MNVNEILGVMFSILNQLGLTPILQAMVLAICAIGVYQYFVNRS